MPNYEAHIVMGDGQDDEVIALDCPDDSEALIAAQRFVDGHDVEVWQGFRKLGTLHRITEAPGKDSKSPSSD